MYSLRQSLPLTTLPSLAEQPVQGGWELPAQLELLAERGELAEAVELTKSMPEALLETPRERESPLPEVQPLEQ